MVLTHSKLLEPLCGDRRYKLMSQKAAISVIGIALVASFFLGRSIVVGGENSVATTPSSAQYPPNETNPPPEPTNSKDLTGRQSPAGIAVGLQIGSTEYDYQKNHSMNRQIGV